MSTADAIAAGIQVIYQDFSIFPNLTVMENLAFNQVLAEKKKNPSNTAATEKENSPCYISPTSSNKAQ